MQEYDITPAKVASLLSTDNPTILEIGCHDGENTSWFIDAFHSPTLHCFEPDPRVLEKFKAKYGNISSLHLHPYALGAESGKMLFYQSSGIDGTDWDASGSLLPPKNHLLEHPHVKFNNVINVDVRTLDSVCEELLIDSIDFIWMDVQGAEGLVISGGRSAFNRARFIFTEYNNNEMYEGQPTMRQLLRLLPNHRVLARYPDDLLLVRRSELII